MTRALVLAGSGAALLLALLMLPPLAIVMPLGADRRRVVMGVHQLRCKGYQVARCTVERLIRNRGLMCAVRGRPGRATAADHNAVQPADLVDRDFIADRLNRLWAADLTDIRR